MHWEIRARKFSCLTSDFTSYPTGLGFMTPLPRWLVANTILESSSVVLNYNGYFFIFLYFWWGDSNYICSCTYTERDKTISYSTSIFQHNLFSQKFVSISVQCTKLFFKMNCKSNPMQLCCMPLPPPLEFLKDNIHSSETEQVLWCTECFVLK